jgi:hypothetical protein
MERAKVVAALVDERAYDGATTPVERARLVSGLTWQAFDTAALELARAGAIVLLKGPCRYPIVDAGGVAYARAGLV